MGVGGSSAAGAALSAHCRQAHSAVQLLVAGDPPAAPSKLLGAGAWAGPPRCRQLTVCHVLGRPPCCCSELAWRRRPVAPRWPRGSSPRGLYPKTHRLGHGLLQGRPYAEGTSPESATVAGVGGRKINAPERGEFHKQLCRNDRQCCVQASSEFSSCCCARFAGKATTASDRPFLCLVPTALRPLSTLGISNVTV